MRVAVVETASFGGLLHYAVQRGNALAARGHDVEQPPPTKLGILDTAERRRLLERSGRETVAERAEEALVASLNGAVHC